MMAVGTMKRKLKWLAIVLAVSLLGFGTVLFLWPRDRITVASWEKIRIGMTEKEVEDILGEPGLSYQEYLDQYAALEKKIGKEPFIPDGVQFWEPRVPGQWKLDMTKSWIGRSGLMDIQFDEAGHVKWKVLAQWRPANPTFIEHLRDWLGW
jgi:hypothetical protein